MPPPRNSTVATPRSRAPAAAPPMPPAMHELVLFVSCVAGKPVARLRVPGPPQRGVSVGGAPVTLIGAGREGGQYVYDEQVVVALTRAEVEMHGRVYERAIAEGDLRRRTRADFETWKRALLEREKKAAAEAHVEPAAPAGGSGS